MKLIIPPRLKYTPSSQRSGQPVTHQDVTDAPVFREWLDSYSRSDWSVLQVCVQAASFRNGRLSRLLLDVLAEHQSTGESRRELIFLRGRTVDVLCLVSDGQREYVLFVEQFRVAMGQDVISNPSGQIDDGESPAQAGLREVGEELGAQLWWSPLNWLGDPDPLREAPLLVTPGGSDEQALFGFSRATVTPQQLQTLHGHVAGLASEGEKTTVHLVPVDEALEYLRHQSARVDLKTVTSLLLYQDSLR